MTEPLKATIGQYCSWRLVADEQGHASLVTEIDGKSVDQEIDDAIATGAPMDLDTPTVRFDAEGKAHRVK